MRDWRPAPMVERSEPTSTTLGCGHAMLPTTRLPPMLSPNLDRERGGGYTWPSIGRTEELRSYNQC